MPLTPKQQRELLAEVNRVRRDLAEVISGLDAIKADYDALGPDVATFLAEFFTPQQWKAARDTLASWVARLDGIFNGKDGDGLDKLRNGRITDINSGVSPAPAG